jgi:methyl-accepting chemotaxis protein
LPFARRRGSGERRAMKLRHFLLLSLGLLTACQSAYYAAWEKVGVHKRDLLKKSVIAARDEQKETSEEFQDALARLRKLYAFDGGNLQKMYDEVSSDYEGLKDRSESVHTRVRNVEEVAEALFSEWEKELKEYSSEQLRSESRRRLRETRSKFDDLFASLKRAEASVDPVLVRLKDQVLYLKHNLNARAIASLKGESTAIQTDIGRLIEEMNAAVKKADDFIGTLEE